MRTLAIVLGIIILLGVFVLLLPIGPSVPAPDSAVGNSTYAIPLEHPDGTQTSIGAFIQEDQVLVVNSWATWCPFCVQELPDMVELQEEYEDQIHVIAVNRRESVDQARTYLFDLGVAGGLTYLYDPSDDWYRGIGAFTMPETLFINGRGEVVVHKRGFMALEEMREHVEKTLATQ